jgi:hypothetical protein
MEYIYILENYLKEKCRQKRLPLYTEYKFHPKRKFRFDYAIPMVAFEYEGGIYQKSRHTTATGYSKDCEKYNQAALLGWRVFRFTPAHFSKREIGKTFEIIDKIFETINRQEL